MFANRARLCYNAKTADARDGAYSVVRERVLRYRMLRQTRISRGYQVAGVSRMSLKCDRLP